jgi:hypothetical protein
MSDSDEERIEFRKTADLIKNDDIGFIGTIGTVDKPETRRDLKTERSRFGLVLFLMSTIFIILVIPFALLLFGIELKDKYWEYLHIAFPALLGVFGSATAFYFERR